MNFFPKVLVSNPSETTSEKGMWRSSVILCLVCISVTEAAQEIWCMANVEESRRLWGSVVVEDGMGCRLFGTQLSSAFPKVKQAHAQHLQSLHALVVHPPWTLCPCAKIVLYGPYFDNICWLLPAPSTTEGLCGADAHAGCDGVFIRLKLLFFTSFLWALSTPLWILTPAYKLSSRALAL